MYFILKLSSQVCSFKFNETSRKSTIFLFTSNIKCSFCKEEHFQRHHIMETFNNTYSKKNIQISSENECKLKLIMKMENFLKRMRWTALAFLGKLKRSDKGNYGFKTMKCPSSVKELVPFEHDMIDMIKNLGLKELITNFNQI